MDESDEEVDPLVGPIAELMAEHNLASTTVTEKKKPVEISDFIEPKIEISDYLSLLNIRTLFKDVFNYFLDHQWYSYLNETFVHQRSLSSPLKKLFVLFIIYAILTSPLPLTFHLLPFLYILFLFIVDFLLPFFISYNWFQCLNCLQKFIQTIHIHQQWLIKIHGFQLIRPTSSLFENQLYQLRRSIFEQLRKHFLITRQIARQYAFENDQLICYIDLDEFGPLIQLTDLKLEEVTNQYDQISINSMFKLSHLQINECIQLIHLNRPKSYWFFHQYQIQLNKSIEQLNKIKQNCSIMIDYLSTDKPTTSKLISSYFLLRSNCEQLFEMNEKETINSEQLKRIIQDIKTVLYSLQAIQAKPTIEMKQNTTEQILSNENPPSNISSYHRYDDQMDELVDEILVGETGQINEDFEMNQCEIEDDDRRFLREQTNCLMKELQTAIQGKKQEWNEREQRLFGHVETTEEIPLVEKKKPVIYEQSFERVVPMSSTITMLDELKHSFALNREKLNMNEDTFGEEDIIGDSDDDDDVD